MKLPLVAGAIALLLAALLPFCDDDDDVARRPLTDVGSEDVVYETEDGVRIVAGWFLPTGEPNGAAVILLHERDGTRAQWEALIPTLLDEGYAVLAPDLRGFGESTTIIRDGQEEPYAFGSPVELVLDVAAAIEWLKGRSEIDSSKIGAVGAGLGGDLAYVSTGVFPEVQAAVAMSPGPYNPEDPLLTSIRDFAGHDVCFMASARTPWERAVTLAIRVQHPGGKRYIDSPDLEGVALLAIDEPIQDTLAWLKERLLDEGDTSACMEG